MYDILRFHRLINELEEEKKQFPGVPNSSSFYFVFFYGHDYGNDDGIRTPTDFE